jgi:hypothetical protein
MELETDRLILRNWRKNNEKYYCMADGELKDEIITGLLKEEWIAYLEMYGTYQ